jgi:hypothetical protein
MSSRINTSIAAGYNSVGKAAGNVPVGDIAVDSENEFFTANLNISLPYDPIRRVDFMFGNANLPGDNTTSFYNTVSGQRDVALVTTASSNVNATGHSAWQVLNTDQTADWVSATSYDVNGTYMGTYPEGGEWVRINFPYTVSILGYYFCVKSTAWATVNCKNWRLMGSRNHGASWQTIDRFDYKTAADKVWTGSSVFSYLTPAFAAQTYTDVKLVLIKISPNQFNASVSGLYCMGCQHNPNR